jgi:hypothetical protein
MMIKIFGEVHSSKNSHRIWNNKRTGQPFIVKSKASKADEKTFLEQFIDQRDEWKMMTYGKKYPLVVVFHFRRRTRAKFDYLNIAQGLADAMQKAGYFPDDCMNYFIPDFASSPYEVCPKDPGCDIFIAEYYG